ncbi:Major facilitator superfamily domain, general substrate transporter [Penicillium griseofulvum]|uniref:Citrate exporter 1 n=1 Tax=Penicillium patulum TaxID=5078 RepID=A0A135LSM6_PENPA|nr:Major facilitator superfamily domain, general substrate transporter [Penicillium griseofulvum]KXG51977.1 Major facilitator superfamily domain, general substrate transporter [Penicillium griseofulvum]
MNNQDQQIRQEDEVNEETPLVHVSPRTEPYSVFTSTQKRLIILTAALASSFSPLSANIYYPALNSIAKDLHVSPSQINLTITTYMGFAPMLTGSLADQAGRRPAYILCFTVYILGNIALALQHSFPTLLALRAVQSCGSSGTVALASAVAADIITSAERGMYMGFASLGNILAPSIGPILGGVLSKYLGWQAIFWFLAIAAGTFFVPLLLFFPETCRGIVGNGSSPTIGWNRTIWSYLQTTQEIPAASGVSRNRKNFPNPCSTLRLLSHRPVGLVLLANGVIFSSYYAITAGIPALFQKIYDLDDLGIGLCFIPAGLGSLLSATANGVLVDWNYRRARQNAGQTVHKNQKQDIIGFPIEQARLQIGVPMIILAAVSMIVYGVLIPLRAPLLVALTVVFIICFCITAAYNVMNILIVDLYYETPATAMAANNLVRCFLGAGAAAVVNPLIKQVVTLVFGVLTEIFQSVPLTPSQQLQIRYPGGQWINPGMELDIRETTMIPEISSTNLQCNQKYIILFIDLDVIIPGTAIQSVILHWYQPNLSMDCTKPTPPSTIVPGKGHERAASYIAPRAPPNTHHRYVYLLFTQPAAYQFPECFSHVLPETVNARAGFDIKEFVQAAGLDAPIAMNYFIGKHVPSDGENTMPYSATMTSFRSVDCPTRTVGLV